MRPEGNGSFLSLPFLVEAYVRPVLDDEGHDVGWDEVPELRGERPNELGEVGLLVPAEAAGRANPLDVEARGAWQGFAYLWPVPNQSERGHPSRTGPSGVRRAWPTSRIPSSI